MEAGKPSRTAMGAAMLRASHQLTEEPLVFRDPLALPIIGEEAAAKVRAQFAELPLGRRVLRDFMAARSRFAEDRLAEAVNRGTRRYVLLGAGLDTFAYRNPFAAEGLWVYEVDYPPTQAWKRERLAAAAIAPPPSLTYVPIDFERQQLADVLAAAGVVRDEPAFFAWLGVVPYLTRDAIAATLRIIGGWGAGSGVVFDYSEPPGTMPEPFRAAYEARAARMAEIGEPWITTFVPGELHEQLRRSGFTGIDDRNGAALNESYFGGGALGLGVGGRGHVLAALKR